MNEAELAAIRAYLRQWIMADGWLDDAVEELRAGVDGLTTRFAIEQWLDDALRVGIDPL